MENNPTKKLSRAAAILSLTAVLASMPVSAESGYAVATRTAAAAYASTNRGNTTVRVSAELSCEFGPISDSKIDNSGTNPPLNLQVEVYETDDQKGEGRSSRAEAWVGGIRVGYDEYNW